MDECYIGQAQDDRLFELRGVPSERYEACEEIQQGRAVVDSKERKRCNENYGNVYDVQLRMQAKKGDMYLF